MSSELVEHAIFTSAHARGREGYHLVTTSPGISEAEARELSVWGPTHDSLNCNDMPGGSINFHQLHSGRFCISRTTSSRAEYSSRGGKRVYTDSLVVPAAVFERFGNNPFRVVEAARALGHMSEMASIPETLSAFRLIGRASSIDTGVVHLLMDQLGTHTLMAYVQAVISSSMIAFQGAAAPNKLFAALLALLPPTCRPEISFSTGLRYSPRRPFRLSAIPSDGRFGREAAKTHRLIAVESAAQHGCRIKLGPWCRFALEILCHRRLDQLSNVFERMPKGTRLSDLDTAVGQIEEDHASHGSSILSPGSISGNWR